MVRCGTRGLGRARAQAEGGAPVGPALQFAVVSNPRRAARKVLPYKMPTLRVLCAGSTRVARLRRRGEVERAPMARREAAGARLRWLTARIARAQVR